MATQVLLCGAGQAGSGLGFLASARVLARLNAVSCRVFPLPPALARGQGFKGDPGVQPPAGGGDSVLAGVSGAPVRAERRDPDELTGVATAVGASGCGTAAGSCEDVPAGAGRTDLPPAAEGGDQGEPAAPETPGAASGVGAAAAPAEGLGKVLRGQLLMRLSWSGASGMEVDMSVCPPRLDVGVQPALSCAAACRRCRRCTWEAGVCVTAAACRDCPPVTASPSTSVTCVRRST